MESGIVVTAIFFYYCSRPFKPILMDSGRLQKTNLISAIDSLLCEFD